MSNIDEMAAALCGWEPIDSYPKTGEQFEILYENGSIEQDVYWSDTRYCILGAPMGSRGPGLLSTEAGNLPIDPEDGITHWRRSPPPKPSSESIRNSTDTGNTQEFEEVGTVERIDDFLNVSIDDDLMWSGSEKLYRKVKA